MQQQDQDLNTFIQVVKSSAFILPFDTTSSRGGTSLTELMTNTTTTPFPPPLACYPDLSSSQLTKLNSLETGVFGLPSVSSPSSFDTSCFPDRPVYGVVDLLRLRLPFPDDRQGWHARLHILEEKEFSVSMVPRVHPPVEKERVP